MREELISGVVDRVCAQVAGQLDDTGQAQVSQAQSRLREPLRLAVAGRVKAGKSTLVNALVGRRVAPTRAGECTKVVTWYRYGSPDRAEVVLRDGSTRELPFTGGVLPEDPGVPVTEVERIDVRLQSSALRSKTLIDTPGLATMTAGYEDATRRALLAGSTQAAGQADAVLFVFREAERVDEVEFLRQFHAASGDLAVSAVNAVGVLTQADLFGSGTDEDEDPFAIAEVQAHRLAAARRAEVCTVVPVSGLMAEAARTGRVREVEAALLRTLAEVDLMDLKLRDVLGPPAGVDDSALTRLYDVLGSYAVHTGRRHAAAGAGQFTRWLDERSGVAALEQVIQHRLVRRSFALKVIRLLEELAGLARQHRCAQAVDAVEAAQLDPALHPLRELRALQVLTVQAPRSRLRAGLEAVVDADTDHELLGCDPTAGPAELAATARRLAGGAQAAATLSAWPAEAEAGRVLARSYTLAARRVERAPER